MACMRSISQAIPRLLHHRTAVQPNTTGNPFEHKRLKETSFHIRLLKVARDSRGGISISLQPFELESAPVYCALSYTWGEDTLLHSVNVNGALFAIRDNLQSFFDTMLNKDDFKRHYWWIDQLCIDQTSLHERSIQVSKLGLVYQRAKYVVTWLGLDPHAGRAFHFMASVCEIQDTFQVGKLEVKYAKWVLKCVDQTPVMETMQHRYSSFSHGQLVRELFGPLTLNINGIARYLQANPPGERPKLDFHDVGLEDREAMTALLHNPYWQRVWIIQDFVFADKLLVLYGSQTCSGEGLYDFLCTDFGLRYMHPSVIWMSNLRSTIAQRIVDGTQPSLYEALDMTSESYCEDAKDIVYGLNGLLQQHEALEVEYTKSAKDVFVEVGVRVVLRYLLTQIMRFRNDGDRLMLEISVSVHPGQEDISMLLYKVALRMGILQSPGNDWQESGTNEVREAMLRLFLELMRRRVWIWHKNEYADENMIWILTDARARLQAGLADIVEQIVKTSDGLGRQGQFPSSFVIMTSSSLWRRRRPDEKRDLLMVSMFE